MSNGAIIFISILAVPIALYILVRLASSAYFQSKYDHMKRRINDGNSTSDDKHIGK